MWFYFEKFEYNLKWSTNFSHTYVFALASRNNKPKNKMQTMKDMSH